MKKIIFFFCIALLSLQSFAKTKVVIPIEIDKQLPYIKLEINNAAVPFLLDSGSQAGIHLAEKLAHSIHGLQYTGTMVRSMDLAGKVRESKELIVPELDVYGMKFFNLKGEIHSPWGLGGGIDPNISVLGMGFFAEKKIIINFSAKTLTMAEGGDEIVDSLDSWIALPFEKTNEGYVLRIPSENKIYRMILDTASTISIIRSSAIDKATVIDKCDYYLGPGEVCETSKLSLLGDHRLHPYVLSLPEEFKADGILGNDFFSKFSVLFDLKNKLFYVRPENS